MGSSVSSSAGQRGRRGGGDGGNSGIFGINPSRLPRPKALSCPHLCSIDGKRLACWQLDTNQSIKWRQSVAIRAAVGDDRVDGSMMPSPSSSTSSPSMQQQQEDLDLLRRAQARDTGTTYPLEETKVTEEVEKDIEIEWLDRGNSFSFFLFFLTHLFSTSTGKKNRKPFLSTSASSTRRCSRPSEGSPTPWAPC